MLSSWVLSVADFPKFEFTMHDVKRAGEALKGDLIWDESHRDDVLNVFKVANSWIDSHAYPMFRLKTEAVAKIRKCNAEGIVFARLKRMRSVRRKLATLSTKLDQVQDLGGCRIICPSIAGLNKVVDAYRDAPKHKLHNDRSYIAKPKPGGYRSHHFIYRFKGGKGSEVYDGRRIELQIRTRLQHAWATAVEAVGTFRREDMKAGKGDPGWLRLFDLMSSELALAEKCPESPTVPSHRDRVKEICDLNANLKAIETLDSMRQAVRYTTSFVQGSEAPEFYRIQFNRMTKEVNVAPHSRPISGLKEQHAIEQSGELTGDTDINTVFVSADSIEALREGYPNYFGDVELFNMNLRHIVQGRQAKEYTMAPQTSVPVEPRQPGDLRWLRPGGKRRWE